MRRQKAGRELKFPQSRHRNLSRTSPSPKGTGSGERGCRELESEAQLRAAERWASASARALAGRAAALAAGTYLVERAREWVSLCEEGGEVLGESGETDPGKMWTPAGHGEGHECQVVAGLRERRAWVPAGVDASVAQPLGEIPEGAFRRQMTLPCSKSLPREAERTGSDRSW
ncbi:hypothetical protein H8959_009916 [Pygathrix nigripes]